MFKNVSYFLFLLKCFFSPFFGGRQSIREYTAILRMFLRQLFSSKTEMRLFNIFQTMCLNKCICNLWSFPVSFPKWCNSDITKIGLCCFAETLDVFVYLSYVLRQTSVVISVFESKSWRRNILDTAVYSRILLPAA